LPVWSDTGEKSKKAMVDKNGTDALPVVFSNPFWVICAFFAIPKNHIPG